MDYASLYGQLHRNPKYFQGTSIKPYVDMIGKLVSNQVRIGKKITKPRLLDFGCGKGHQYLRDRVHERWGGCLPECYDIGVRGLSVLPPGTFDGVICTDVMEHLAEEDIIQTMILIRSLLISNGFVFMSICTREASRKVLPDGRNVHLTVKPRDWWGAKIDEAFYDFKGTIRVEYEG